MGRETETLRTAVGYAGFGDLFGRVVMIVMLREGIFNELMR